MNAVVPVDLTEKKLFSYIDVGAAEVFKGNKSDNRNRLSFSGMPISRTSKGSENRFEKSGLKLQGFSNGNELWFEKSGGLRNRGFEKSGFHCI